LARFTRHELKQDQLRTTLEAFEQLAKAHYRELAGGVSALIVILGLATGLKLYNDRQEAAANAQLGAALKTFRAYVGSASPEVLGADAPTFATAQEKYKKARDQFSEVARQFPHQKAAAIARYHLGVCQAALGEHAAATKTLEEASRASDQNIASLAKFALAGEYASSGRLAEAEKLYRDLAAHPSFTVPKASALMALADADRATKPAQSRELYQNLEREFGSDLALAGVIKEQMSGLPK
jgi:TolA-binding protein